MPRTARLDVPYVLQHVMARGIEGRDLFHDKKNREEFLRRLSELMKEGRGQLLAWSLMPSHFHLLFRPFKMPLSTIMRRLLTGYAVWYNRRYARKGHLFQNRYKSIVVEEDPYFLELVRYIHLNPVRGGILSNLSELDRYPYTGHAVIMGHRRFSCQDTNDVLKWFGTSVREARRSYHGFVEARGSNREGERSCAAVGLFAVLEAGNNSRDGEKMSENRGMSEFWEVDCLLRRSSELKANRQYEHDRTLKGSWKKSVRGVGFYESRF